MSSLTGPVAESSFSMLVSTLRVEEWSTQRHRFGNDAFTFTPISIVKWVYTQTRMALGGLDPVS